MTTPETTPLWLIELKVKPKTWHPLFWKIEFGRLFMWVFGATSAEVEERALTIFSQLPYELAENRIKLNAILREGVTDELAGCETEARATGFAMILVGAPVGTDDSKFMAAPLGGI